MNFLRIFIIFLTIAPMVCSASDSAAIERMSPMNAIKILLDEHQKTVVAFNETVSQPGQEEAESLWQRMSELNSVMGEVLAGKYHGIDDRAPNPEEESLILDAISAISMTESYDIIVAMAQAQSNKSPVQPHSLWWHHPYVAELGKRLSKRFETKSFEKAGAVADWDIAQSHKVSCMILGMRLGTEHLYNLTQRGRLFEDKTQKDFEKIYQRMANLGDFFEGPYVQSGIIKSTHKDEEKQPFQEFVRDIYGTYHASMDHALSKDNGISLDYLFQFKKKTPAFEIGYGILNRAAENYLAEYFHNPKLLIACGHVQNPEGVTAADDKDRKNRPYHEHPGWYTVDLNLSFQPDFVADITQKETTDYLGNVFEGKLKVIYGENPIPDVFWNEQTMPMMYKALRRGGHVICHYGNWSKEDMIQKLTVAGFAPEKIHFYEMPISLTILGQTLRQLPEFETIASLDEVDPLKLAEAMQSPSREGLEKDEIEQKRLETNPTEDEKPYAKLIPGLRKQLEIHKRNFYENVQKDLPKVNNVINNLKILGSIDPMFEWAFKNDKYVIVEK